MRNYCKEKQVCITAPEVAAESQKRQETEKSLETKRSHKEELPLVD